MTEAKTTNKAKTTGSAKAPNGAEFFTKGQETLQSLFSAGTEAMSGNYDKWIALNQEQATAAMNAFTGWDDVTEIGKENAEAWVASSKIAAQSFEQIADKMMGYVTTSVEEGVATSKAMLECRDVKALVDLQTQQIRKSVDTIVAEGTELSEMSVQAATKAMTPLNERFNATVDKMAKTGA
jgi:phasin family protein